MAGTDLFYHVIFTAPSPSFSHCCLALGWAPLPNEDNVLRLWLNLGSMSGSDTGAKKHEIFSEPAKKGDLNFSL